eukprot:scaffold209226_cov23-Cyclotella_meneghiniana.AAC.1
MRLGRQGDLAFWDVTPEKEPSYHLCGRNADAHVKLFEVFPNKLHSGLVKNNPELFKDDTNDIKDGDRAQLEVGMEVKVCSCHWSESICDQIKLEMAGYNGVGRTHNYKKGMPAKDSLLLQNGLCIVRKVIV